MALIDKKLPAPPPRTTSSTSAVTTPAAPFAPATPPPAAPRTGLASAFADATKRPLSLSGAFKSVKSATEPSLPTTPASVFQQLEAGKAQAGTLKKAPAFNATSFLAGLAKKPAIDVQTAIGGLSGQGRAAVLKAVGSGKASVTADVVRSLALASGPEATVAMLKGVPLDVLKQVSKAARGESIASLNVPLAVELAARTSWGKEHATEVNDLRKRITSQTNLKGGLKEGLGSFRDGVIKYKDALVAHPEALAAVLAHEVTHAHQGTDCCGGEGASGVEGEAAGNTVTAQVWNELSDGTDKTVPDLQQFEGYGKAFKEGGAAAVRTRMLNKYLENANAKIAERQSDAADGTTRKPDDTLEAWQAHAKKFEDALKKDVKKK